MTVTNVRTTCCNSAAALSLHFTESMVHVPKGLSDLLERQEHINELKDEYAELLRKLDEIIAARAQGSVRMELPIELGAGYHVEGVVSVFSDCFHVYQRRTLPKEVGVQSGH